MKTVGPALQYLFAVRGDQDSIPHFFYKLYIEWNYLD